MVADILNHMLHHTSITANGSKLHILDPSYLYYHFINTERILLIHNYIMEYKLLYVYIYRPTFHIVVVGHHVKFSSEF
jgi:hypothetical protein